MKFKVSSTDLLKQLQVASGAVMSNPVIPILEDFLFTLQGNLLTICSTDLESTTITSLEVQTEEDGIVAVPAKILVDTLKALPEQPITIDVNEDNYHIKVTSAYGNYTLAGHNPEDFPKIPEPEDADNIQLSGSIFVKAITHTLFATSNDELRLAMTGILVQVDFSKITFVATDAHKLVKYQFHNIESDVTTSFILPKKSMAVLKNVLDEEQHVNFSFTKSNAFFNFGETTVICRLVDAKYPDYNAVIPVENPNLLTVNRKDLLLSLRRIAIYANKTTNQVVLNLAEDSLTVSAQDLDFSNEANEQLTCDYQGDPMVIGFNARFLIEMLAVLDTEQVKFELDTPSRAGILLPTEQEENEDLLMLVMPVMLNY